jgi:hypothetical protein
MMINGHDFRRHAVSLGKDCIDEPFQLHVDGIYNRFQLAVNNNSWNDKYFTVTAHNQHVCHDGMLVDAQ